MAAQELTLRFQGDPAHLKAALGQVRSEFTKTTEDIKRQVKSENQAAIALQKQRSSALIAEWKRQTREHEREQREQRRAAETLQRQRSTALFSLWRTEERERIRIARETERQVQRIQQENARSQQRIGAGIVGGVTALVGFSAVSEIRAGAKAWLEYSSKLESTRIAFTTMLGSAQRASAHLKELQAFAVKTPFQFEELIDASQRMQALGFEAEQVIPILTDVGNAVAAAGGGAERLDRVVLALSQMQSKGKVATQEMNQLAEAGIPAWKILEEQLGKSRAELVKMVEQGKISSAVFLEAFQKFSQQNFGGLMEKQAKTFTGAMSNMKDAALLTSSTALAPLFELLTKMTLQLSRMGLELQESASGFANFTRQVASLTGFMGVLVNSQFPGLLQFLSKGTELAVRFGTGLGVLREQFKLFSVFSTPEITGPTIPELKPVPLPKPEVQAELDRVSALKVASEEAKRIAADRIAEQERAFKLGQITRKEETEAIISALQERAKAENQAIEEEITRKNKELNENRQDAEKTATIIEQINNLQERARSNEAEAAREAANRRTELQVQERRDLLTHEQAKLDILLNAGQAQIQLIESRVRAGVTTAESGNQQIEKGS